MVLDNFHDVVSGAAASFFEKYGDRADKIALCKFHVSEDAESVISDVLGTSLTRRDVMCEAKGCKGSVDLE
jgi:hypothetical protein